MAKGSRSTFGSVFNTVIIIVTVLISVFSIPSIRNSVIGTATFQSTDSWGLNKDTDDNDYYDDDYSDDNDGADDTDDKDDTDKDDKTDNDDKSDKTDNKDNKDKNDNTDKDDKTDEAASRIWINDKCCTYYYQLLSSKEKEIYDAIKHCVQYEEKSIVINSTDKETATNSFNKALNAYYREHPETFWLTRGYKYVINSKNTKFTLSNYDFFNYIDVVKYQSKIKEVLDSYASNFPSGASEYEKAKIIHDILVKTNIYDYDGLENSQKANPDPASDLIYTSYGCMVNGKCVCNGFAMAYSLILNYYGIDCIYVTGYAGGLHAWNMTEFDGQYYNIDVTWDNLDDATYNNEPRYNYFCVDDATISADHTVDEELFDLPSCVSKTYNYFVYSGICFDTYDFDTLSDAFVNQSPNVIRSVAFTNTAALEQAVNDLHSNGGIFKVPGIKGHTVSSNSDTNFKILTFYIND